MSTKEAEWDSQGKVPVQQWLLERQNMNTKETEWDATKSKPYVDIVPPEEARRSQISTALALAQTEMTNPSFDTSNPFFKNRFASLAAVRNAVVPVMAKHGIFVSQDLRSGDATVSCTTILTHASGQQMRFGPLVLPVSKNDAQGFGSAATYCRRYSLMAVACVVGDDDDDANAATGKPPPAYSEPHLPKGDMGKNIKPEDALVAALSMRTILEQDAEQEIISLLVADRHDEMNKDHDLYIAAADRLTPAERAAWKKYLKIAKDIEAREPKGRF